MMIQGERKLEYENFKKSMKPEELEPGQELVFQEKIISYQAVDKSCT